MYRVIEDAENEFKHIRKKKKYYNAEKMPPSWVKVLKT